MATEIDALQLNFTASSSSVDKSIERMIQQLTRLGDSIKGVNSGGLANVVDNISSNLTNLEFAVNNIESAKLKEISGGMKSLANSLKSFSDVGNISSTFSQIASGMQAVSGVNTDFSGISTLANSINRLGSGQSVQASQILTSLSNGLRSFSGVTLPNLAGIDQFAQGLRSLGSGGVRNAAALLTPIAQALKDFENIHIPSDLGGLGELAKSLSMFGRASTTQAVTNIPLLATAFRNLITTLSTAPTINRSVIDLANAMANLASSGGRAGTAVYSLTGRLNFFGNTARNVSRRSFSLASAIGKVYATYFLLFRAFGKIREAIDISSQLKEVQNVVDTTFGDMTNKVEEFAQTSIKNFGMSELSAKQYASRFQAMGAAMAIPAQSVAKAQQQLNKIHPELLSRGYSDTADSIADMSINITKLAADMASFYNVEQADVAKDLESIYTGMTRPLRQYGLDLTEATLKEWAMKNGLDADIKSMTQAEKTLLRYQYVLANTSAAQGDFAKTSVTWANQIRILQQNFQRLGAVIGSGFIAWLRPMVIQVNAAMDSIIAAVQKTVNALGKIFGWQMIVDTTGDSLIDDTEAIADGYDDATAAAKNFAKQLLGIDEINNLTTNESGKGSGDDDLYGGLRGGNIIEPGGISFERFESDIDSLFELGKKISDKLKNMMDSIDWDSVYERAKGFGKGLADFLNGLIQPETFYQIGRTIAGLLNTGISAIFSFGITANWEQWGNSIAEQINGFFDTFDFSQLANSIDAWVQGLWKMLKTAVRNINWKNVFVGLGDLIFNLDVNTIYAAVSMITITKVGKWILSGKVFSGLIDAVKKGFVATFAKGITISSVIPFNIKFGVGTATGDTFLAFVEDNLVSPLLNTIFDLIPPKVGDAIERSLAGAILGAAAGSWGGPAGILVGVILGAIIGWFTSESAEPARKAISDFFINLGNSILDALKTVFKWDNVVNFFEMAESYFNDISAAFADKDWLRIGKDILFGIIDALLAPAQLIAAPFQNLFEWIWDGICEIFGIHSPAEEMKPIGKNIILGILEGFSLVNFANKMTEWWNNNVKPWFTIEKWKTLGDNIKTGLSTKWTEFTTWFNNTGFMLWWNSVLQKFDRNKWNFSGISEGLMHAWSIAIEGIKGIWNDFANWLNGLLNFSWDAVKIAGKEIIPGGSINLGRIPTFANGGFPEQGSLFLAGETYGKSEWVGNIGGRTGVVSNDEITGIAQAIYQTSSEEMVMLRQQNQLLQGILEKEFGISESDIGRSARNYGIDYYNRTGNQAFIF